jgi:choline kinase
MRVIIYAAGISRRLKSVAGNGLKGLLKLNGKRIIEYQLDWIVTQSISDIVIVLGLEHELYKETFGDSYKGISIIYVYNPDYKDKGNMLSLWHAREYCDTDVLFTTSDLICDYEDIAGFNNSEHQNKILIDNKSVDLFRDSDPVKVSINDGIITGIHKNKSQLKSVDGVAIGLYQFSFAGINGIISVIEENIKKGLDDLSLYYAIGGILSDYEVNPVFAKKCLWFDIDTPSDLHNANNSI